MYIITLVPEFKDSKPPTQTIIYHSQFSVIKLI